MPTLFPLIALLTLLGAPPSPVGAQAPLPCAQWDPQSIRRNPTERELRCRFGAHGPGRFGLLSYADVPVYQPATPMPGTHVVGPGHARPLPGESYEAWEWRVLRTDFGPEARVVHRSLELLDPRAASRILRFEQRLAEEGVRAVRLETWRSPQRQALLFQQGRSRPGPLATATLTSWHSQVDERGRPAGRAVDYSVPASRMPRFHRVAAEVGLTSFGADSNDPGHVFLPDPTEERDRILLRLLPRVPQVTLATGLPVDVALPVGGREALRRAAREWAGAELIPFVQPSLASGWSRPVPVLRLHDEARLLAARAGGAVRPAPAGRSGAAAGGGPDGRRRSGAPARGPGGRNTGG